MFIGQIRYTIWRVNLQHSLQTANISKIKHVYGHANEFCLVEGQSSLMGPFEDSFQYA